MTSPSTFLLRKIYDYSLRTIELNEWELQTDNNIVAASKEINSAKPLRCYIDTIIRQAINDLNDQKNSTDEAFRQRIEETKEAKMKLELQHSEARASRPLNSTERLIIRFHYFCTGDATGS